VSAGVGALEMLAIEMKTQGMYVSRGLGFGKAEFELEEVNLTPKMRAMYNASVVPHPNAPRESRR
jgi:hypothetical protein